MKDACWQELKALSGGVVVYCITALSEFLRENGIVPLCYCDDDAAKQGGTIDGIEILSIAEALSRHGKETPVLIASVWQTNRNIIESKLSELGVANVIRVDDSIEKKFYLISSEAPDWTIDRASIRQQKADFLRIKKHDYSVYLIGSSKIRQMDGHDVGEKDFFNYWVPSAIPEEYDEFMWNVGSGNNRKIYLALDFFGTNKNSSMKAFDKFNPLILCATEKKDLEYFDKNIDEQLQRASKGCFSEQDAKFDADKQMGKYAYREDLRKIFSALRGNLVVFITPESAEYIRELFVKRNFFDYYLRFVGDAVESFGQVYNFNYINSVTSNREYWHDSYHITKRGIGFVGSRISGGNNCPEDFGLLVDRDNLFEHYEFLRENIFSE